MLPSILKNVIAQEGNGQILISWSFQAGATSYTVHRSTDQIVYTEVATPTEPQYLDEDVISGTQYWYKVAGVNGEGTGQFCLPVSEVPTISGHETLGQIRLQAQQRADRVHSNFVTKAEWDNYINQSYFALYDLLVQKYGDDYYVAPPLQIDLTGEAQYPLPNGVNYEGAPPIYKLLGVDLAINPVANSWITLKRYNFISRNRYVYPQITTNLLGYGGMRYRVLGTNLHFIPTPQGGQTVRLWYIPRMVRLLKDTDMLDGVSGWSEFIIVDAAIKALIKEESDVTTLVALRQDIVDRIESAAENRDAGEPDTISSTRRWGDTWGWGDNGDDGPIGGI